MRRHGTWLVVGALAALGVAAAVDSIQDPSTRRPPPRREQTQALPPALPPAKAGLRGVLYYTDARCRLHAVRLPDLEPVATLASPGGCRFSLTPTRVQAADAAVWQPNGPLVATPAGRGFELASTEGGGSLRIVGRSPAFKPDGTLTYVRDGAVVAWSEAGGPNVLFTRRDLAGPLRFDANVPRDPGSVADVSVEKIAWLADDRLVAVLALDVREVGREDLLAVYEGKRLLRTVPAKGVRFSGLQVSPRRRFVAARSTRPSGFVFLDRGARPFSLAEVERDHPGRAPFTGGRALAWSPDDRWTAIATRASVLVFSMTREGPAFVRLPLAARDLAWRAR